MPTFLRPPDNTPNENHTCLFFRGLCTKAGARIGHSPRRAVGPPPVGLQALQLWKQKPPPVAEEGYESHKQILYNKLPLLRHSKRLGISWGLKISVKIRKISYTKRMETDFVQLQKRNQPSTENRPRTTMNPKRPFTSKALSSDHIPH